MRSPRSLTLPLAFLAVVLVGLVMTGAVRYTLGPPAEAAANDIPGYGDSGGPACGDPAPAVHVERDATIRSTGPDHESRSIPAGT